MELFDGWKFLAGLGLFLFGMFMMEESIKRLSGRSFKILIRRYTGTRASGLITGLVGTAILQSSSAVSLMVLAFVGAGLMTMINAIAVIMGAMVGTTLTAWIVAVFGFKFKIESFALPLIGIGGLGLVFMSSSTRYASISKLLAAFGFLFLGLDYMKTSVEAFAAAMDLALLSDLGLWVYVLSGVLLTAIMQSSSATIAIILTTIYSGIVAFDQGAALVIGANVGTTVTILIGAIGGIPAKKQAAAGSLLFKAGTALVVFAALPLLLWVIRDVVRLVDNPVLGIALFHTLFNVIGVAIFFPLIPALARRLERLFPEKRTVLAQFITNTTAQVPEAAYAALRREVLNQLNLSMRYIAGRYKLRQNTPGGFSQSLPHLRYADLERLHAEIFSFYAQAQTVGLDQSETRGMEAIIRSSRSIMNATKNLYDLLPEVEEIGAEDNPFMIKAYQDLKARLQEMRGMSATLAQRHEDETLLDVLLRFFQAVEDADKHFIGACSKAVARGTIRIDEVTRLLMINRLFTQSNRMLVLSMQNLAHGGHASDTSLRDAPAS